MSQKKLAYDVKKVVDDSNFTVGDNRPLETNVSIRTEKKKIPLPPSVIVFQRFAYLAATRLTPTSNVIMMLFISRSAYENYIGMDTKTIAEELNYSKRSVLRGLKELEDHNVIIKITHPSDRRRNDYFINPIAAWKGNSFTRKKAISKIAPAQLDLFKEK